MHSAMSGNSTTSSDSVTDVSPNTLGLLAGLATFLGICAIFGAVACFTMWRIRPSAVRLRHRNDDHVARNTKMVLTPSGPALQVSLDQATISSTRNGIVNGSFHEISSRHYMKNGFHQVTPERMRRDLARTRSSPGGRSPSPSRGDDLPLPPVMGRASSVKVKPDGIPEESPVTKYVKVSQMGVEGDKT